MTDRPILFNGAAVRAILAGRKTQTRRPFTDPPLDGLTMLPRLDDPSRWVGWGDSDVPDEKRRTWEAAVPNGGIRCPFGAPGDRLYVRETFAGNLGTAGGYVYRADVGDSTGTYLSASLPAGDWTHRVDRWTPSIHMPRAAARIWLRVDRVGVQRVQDISEEDAASEGVGGLSAEDTYDSIRDEFFGVWRSIYGDDLSAWAWCCSFTVLSTTGEPDA